MKNIKNIYTIILSSTIVVFSALTLNSCNQGKPQQQEDEISLQDVGNEMEEAVDTTMAYLSEEKENMVVAYEKRLNKINNQIDMFKGEMESASESARETYRVQIDKLESGYSEVQKDLDEFEDATEDAWNELREGLEEAFNELEEGIEDAREAFDNK